MDTFQEILKYTIPSFAVFILFMYLFNRLFKSEEIRLNYLLKNQEKQNSLPLKMQACERFTVFLERIKPIALVMRVHPNSSDLAHYQMELVEAIQQEFEHNISQQIYISENSWHAINAAKLGNQNYIYQLTKEISQKTAQELQQKIIEDSQKNQKFSNHALLMLKNEVNLLFV